MSIIDLSAKRLNGPVIRLHPNDNVVVARIPVEAGTSIPGENMLAREAVKQDSKRVAQVVKGWVASEA
jgi:altronate hydrolase